MKINLFLSLVVLMTSLIGCQPTSQYLGDPELPYPPDRDPVVGDILHLPTGFFVDQGAMLDQAGRTQVVFVGETHDNPASHRLQENILQALEQNNPGNITLAMEMFTPSQQKVLDLWVSGKLSEKEFLQQVNWYHNWGMNFAFYRPLLNYCRDHKIPILALNAEKSLKQNVARTPWAELTAEEQEQLPEMDHRDPYQQAMVHAIFSDHKMGEAMLDGFQRVQTLWDETMAQNLAAYLQNEGKNRQILVIAGGNHIRYGFGIPRRLFRRVPVSFLLIGSEELEIPEDKKDRLMNVVKPAYPMPPYHFLTFTRYEDLPNPGVKLGIMLDKVDKGLMIKGVIPGSIAELQGLKEGDILMQIDAQQLKEPFDLIYELQQKSSHDHAELTLQRQSRSIIKEIHFSTP
ncbi:ChaN family lipoprotein [uncultured Desulfuromusa sp.]|uniref:ChaN family lipoprotein n=1 Tax=uncultured Desulfuromusa sp. TaxID=219183 RepID=UPI002AA8943D|nr:ChaN family lipoprotein [uncultured Desulfuromusa sp.]